MYVFINQRVRNYKHQTWWSCLHIIVHNHWMHKTILSTGILNQLTCSSMELVHVVRADVCVPRGLSHRDQQYHQPWLVGSQMSGGWPMWCATTRRVVRKICWNCRPVSLTLVPDKIIMRHIDCHHGARTGQPRSYLEIRKGSSCLTLISFYGQVGHLPPGWRQGCGCCLPGVQQSL